MSTAPADRIPTACISTACIPTACIPTDCVTVVVIAKEPVPGRVKTRLCPPCTPRQAADIAEAALRDTLDAVAAADVAGRVLALEGSPMDWIPPEFRIVAQRGDGLGERLGAVVHDVHGPVLVIGMDTPQVTPALIEHAVHALCADGVDAVLGPADDGGYWTIGLRDDRPDAFDGVPMSVDSTCSEQRRRLDDLGLRTSMLEALSDVDTFDEAVRVSRLVPHSGFAAAVARAADTAAPTEIAGVGHG